MKLNNSLKILAYYIMMLSKGIIKGISMSNIALQITRTSYEQYISGSNIIFDTVVYANGNISYDLNDGIVVFNEPGQYLINWWLATNTALLTDAISFSLVTSQGDSIVGSSPIKTGEVYGCGIIEILTPGTTLRLVNTSPETSSTVMLSMKTSTKVSMTIIEINSSEIPGPTGPTGPANGPIGPTGPTGFRGPTGISLPGPTGPTGIIGPTGPNGGPIGPIGPTGVQGAIGPTGPNGLRGLQGPIGSVGPIGPTGPAGGPTGQKGDKGATGPTGLQGVIGPQGLTGPTGPSEFQGGYDIQNRVELFSIGSGIPIYFPIGTTIFSSGIMHILDRFIIEKSGVYLIIWNMLIQPETVSDGNCVINLENQLATGNTVLAYSGASTSGTEKVVVSGNVLVSLTAGMQLQFMNRSTFPIRISPVSPGNFAASVTFVALQSFEIS